MVSTPTTRLRLEKQSLGSNLNVWGDTKLNDCLERVDEAIGGVQAITISGTATTLTSTNYATDQARKAALVLTGSLSANSTITVPNVEKLYLVVNNTTQGAYSLTIKTAAGSGYALRGGPQWVFCDATDVYRATGRLDQLPAPTAAVDLNSQKITGLGTPTVSTDAATKAYADAGDTTTLAATAASATAAASSATAASGSATSAANSATNSATSATASATSATNSATSATAAAASATAAAGSATAAAASAASISGGPVASVNGATGIVTITAAGLGAAAIASPTFTGTPAAPTASALTSTTQLATTAFVTTANALKADLASPTLTGTPLAPTASAATSTTQIATTAFVTTADALKADLASPTFTGTVTASGGTVSLTNATSNFVLFPAAGIGAPTLTSRSAGTRIVCGPLLSGSLVDYAIGVESSNFWLSVPSSSQNFRYYAATTVISSLSGAGVWTANRYVSDVATGTSPLTVTSTTVCTNLNADTVDGVHAASFATLTGSETLTNKTLTSPTVNGGTAGALTSFGVRSTGAAFDLKLASAEAITGNRTLTVALGDVNRTLTLGGTLTTGGSLTTAGNFVTAGAFTTTLTSTATTSVTLPVSGTLASLSLVNVFTAAVRGSIVALTDAATVAVDAALGNYFSVTLGGNRTLGNPSNLVAGQGGSIIITQDGTGSRTLAYSSNWKFAGGTAPVLTTTAAAVDRLDYLVVSSSLIHAALTKDIK
jgi:hypothetical protein